MREFALIQLSDDSAKQDVPSRLLELVERQRIGVAVGLAGASAATVGGLLGGHLLARLGIGVVPLPRAGRSASGEDREV